MCRAIQRLGECSHGGEVITDNWADVHQPVRTLTLSRQQMAKA